MKSATYEECRTAVREGKIRVLPGGVIQGCRGVKNPVWYVKKFERVRPAKSKAAPYLRTSFTLNDGTKCRVLVHRLVWFCFKGRVPKGYQLNHINGNKLDNRIDNLELTTPSANLKHASKVRLNRGSAILTDKQVSLIKALIKEGGKQSDIARQFGVSPQIVSGIKHGTNYKHVK